MNGAQSLICTLVAGGVETCFCKPRHFGNSHVVAALDRVAEMRCVLGLFEGVVTGAADGYARMAEKPACTLLHLGSRSRQWPGESAQCKPGSSCRSLTSSANMRRIIWHHDTAAGFRHRSHRAALFQVAAYILCSIRRWAATQPTPIVAVAYCARPDCHA
jgi:hypothetical protein